MSSDFSYATTENISAKAKPSGKIEKGLKRLIIIAAIIFAAELIWLFGVTPFVPFSTIDVQGFLGFERADILYMAGIDDNSSFMSTNVNQIQEILSSNILVESAIVSRRFPDRLSIHLIPRQAAAIALTNINGRQVPVYVDRHGIFFKIAETDSVESSLPVISGFENPQINMRLPSLLVPLTESLFEIASSSPELLAAISEIRVERKAWDGFDLVLFPVHSPVRVRVENISEDLLRYVLLVLSVFEGSAHPAEIDFRSGMGSYRIKEQS